MTGELFYVYSTRYVVDGNDAIVSIDEEWLRFARENAAPELTPDHLVGRSLWDFVAGREMHLVYREIFERVRSHDTPILLPFRCDSADRRRYMRLTISPIVDDRLQLDALLVREEPRAPVQLLDAPEARSGFLVMCSWCKKVRTATDVWLEVEDAVVRLDLLGDTRLPSISHSICAECARAVRASMDGVAGREIGS